MIRALPESAAPVLGFEVTGKVSIEEEKEWIGTIEKHLEEHQKISVLLLLGQEASWGVEAGIEDLKWLLKHFKKLDKIALVSDSSVWKWLVAVDSPFAQMVGITEKHFQPSEIADAWAWLKA